MTLQRLSIHLTFMWTIWIHYSKFVQRSYCLFLCQLLGGIRLWLFTRQCLLSHKVSSISRVKVKILGVYVEFKLSQFCNNCSAAGIALTGVNVYVLEPDIWKVTVEVQYSSCSTERIPQSLPTFLFECPRCILRAFFTA